MIRIALDAMGGDDAPRLPVAGAILAQEELADDCEVLLVGRQHEVESELARHGTIPTGLRVVDAEEIVDMREKPLSAIKAKPNSSIAIGIGLQKDGNADAFVSGGNTGAVMAASTLILRLHHGVERPAIAALLPTEHGSVVILDAGANVDCSAAELECFATLGAVFARDTLGRPHPKVALLNIGEENEKGNAAVKEAYQRLAKKDSLNFVGNIEGRDIMEHRCDVVACDGFVGNVVLKLIESGGSMFSSLIRRELDDSTLERPDVQRLFSALDYTTYGGAPLLGVRGVSVICHGSSPPPAIMNAIKVAYRSVRSGLDRHISATFPEAEPASK